VRGTGDVGVYLSGGFDSGAVAPPRSAIGRVRPAGYCLHWVPREDYKGLRRNHILDEGPHAAATAPYQTSNIL
jgi:hypothetical protein